MKTFFSDHPERNRQYIGIELTAEAATIDATEYDEPDLVAIDVPGDTHFEWLGLNWMPAPVTAIRSKPFPRPGNI